MREVLPDRSSDSGPQYDPKFITHCVNCGCTMAHAISLCCSDCGPESFFGRDPDEPQPRMKRTRKTWGK